MSLPEGLALDRRIGLLVALLVLLVRLLRDLHQQLLHEAKILKGT